jgi:hypothetical protein
VHAAQLLVENVKPVLQLDDVQEGRGAGLQPFWQRHHHAPHALGRRVQHAAAAKVDDVEGGAGLAAD